MIYALEIKELDDDFYVEFPVEVLEQLGWKIGDVIVWQILEDGTVKLIKK